MHAFRAFAGSLRCCLTVLLLSSGSCSNPPPQTGHDEADPLLMKAIGTPVGGAEWNALTTKYKMKQVKMKGDDDLESPDHGLSVLSRQHLVWRTIICVNQQHDIDDKPFAGTLPLGIEATDSPSDLIKKLGKPEFDDAEKRQDRWIYYKRSGFRFTFRYDHPPQLAWIMIEADRN